MVLLKILKIDIRKKKKKFSQDVFEQLFGAIKAVFLSWESKRAKNYRKLNHIPDDWGTAVNVQSMVFGQHGRRLCNWCSIYKKPIYRRK